VVGDGVGVSTGEDIPKNGDGAGVGGNGDDVMGVLNIPENGDGDGAGAGVGVGVGSVVFASVFLSL
jgi:hypothetical protein